MGYLWGSLGYRLGIFGTILGNWGKQTHPNKSLIIAVEKDGYEIKEY